MLYGTLKLDSSRLRANGAVVLFTGKVANFTCDLDGRDPLGFSVQFEGTHEGPTDGCSCEEGPNDGYSHEGGPHDGCSPDGIGLPFDEEALGMTGGTELTGAEMLSFNTLSPQLGEFLHWRTGGDMLIFTSECF